MVNTAQQQSGWRVVARNLSIATAAVVGLAAAGAGAWLVSGSEAGKPAATKAARSTAQPVHVVAARQQAIQAWVFAEGTSRSVSRHYLVFDQPGRVTYVKPGDDGGDLRAGDRVKKGELLSQLDQRHYLAEIETMKSAVIEAKTQLTVAQSDIKQAETQYQLANTQFLRTKDLMTKRVGTQSQYEEARANLENAASAREAAGVKVQALQAGVNSANSRLEQSRLALEETEIRSPIDGIIAYLNVEEGFYFTQSNIRTSTESDALQTIPVVVIDPSVYEVTVDIPFYEATRITVGQKVRVVPGGVSAAVAFYLPSAKESATGVTTTAGGDAGGAVAAEGEVFSINPAVNPGGRSVQIKIRTKGDVSKLRDGMFVNCWIEVQNKPGAVVAPFDAFLFEENRPYVFVIDRNNAAQQDGVARRVNITPGIESMSAREIVAGVKPGEHLATGGRYRLVDGAPVRVTNSGK